MHLKRTHFLFTASCLRYFYISPNYCLSDRHALAKHVMNLTLDVEMLQFSYSKYFMWPKFMKQYISASGGVFSFRF